MIILSFKTDHMFVCSELFRHWYVTALFVYYKAACCCALNTLKDCCEFDLAL